ncbi:MAG: ORF6N domain-containing protein [Rhodospirillales bacterium]|nr:ORF6N domain-containing protein [Alphaproteobacteria bacterium]USO04036.1 MAG: ORF6N domain-containing protein [Rhodospirillales bacterium]
MAQSAASIIPQAYIASKIYYIRGQKVMLDSDLAELENWRSQIAISNPNAKMGLRRAPYAFTEHGTLMLSSVLNSPRAIDVNIVIIRTFVKLREILSLHTDVAQKIAEHDQHIANLYDHLERILNLDTKKKNQIGYIWNTEKE